MSAAARGAPVERRAAILEAAIQLFGQYGYRRTSIDDIARAADISKGSVCLELLEQGRVLPRALLQFYRARRVCGRSRALRAGLF